MTSAGIGPASAVAKRRLLTIRVELTVLFVMLVVAVVSGSLILIGETTRSALAAAREIWTSVVHKKAQTGSLQHYEFGLGKLEQAGNFAIALILVVAGLFVADKVFGRFLTGDEALTQFDLALASVALALNTLVCGFSVLRHRNAWQQNNLPSTKASLEEGISRLASLLILQAALTLAALSKDPVIAHWVEILGAGLIALLMILAGLAALWSAVLDLIDHPLHPKYEEAIAQVLLQQGALPEELRDMRSRRAGRDIFVEITLDPAEARSFTQLRQRLVHLKRTLEASFEGLDLTIKLHRREEMPDGSGPSGDVEPKPATPSEGPLRP